MIRTHGLTHIALAVHDAERSLRFYSQVFGAVEVYHQDGFIQAQTPGSRDVLVFEEDGENVGKAGGGSGMTIPCSKTRSISPRN